MSFSSAKSNFFSPLQDVLHLQTKQKVGAVGEEHQQRRNDTIHLQKIIEQLTKMPKPKNADAYDKILQALNVAEKKKQ